MHKEEKNIKRKVGTIFLTALIIILITPTIILTTVASPYHNGNAPDHLQITSVTMSDYNFKCRAIGGDDVSNITVVVKNTGDTTITEDFDVYLYIGQSEFLDRRSISVDLSPGETYPVYFNNKPIYESMGSFTMDAYINDDYDTRAYCNFQVTLTGKEIQSNTSDDVDIEIRAGAYEHTNGNYGLGFLICITNNLDQNITGSIRTYWNFTDKLTVRFDNDSFTLSAHHPEIQVANIDYLHFPFPILKLQVIVKVNETATSVSRSGIEIGPFVFF